MQQPIGDEPELVHNAAEEKAEQDQPVQPFSLDDDALVKKIMGWVKEAYNAKSESLRLRKIDREMYANKQWADEDITAAQKARRVQLTLNMLLTIISAVEGEERSNRQEIKFYGNGVDDDPAAEGLNLILKWIMQGCGGEFALSTQFQDQIKIGQGWVVPEIDFFEDPEGKIKLSYVPDNECFEDPLSQSTVGDGDRYFNRVKQMAEEELEARWPGSCDKIRASCFAGDVGAETDGKGYRDIYLEPSKTNSLKLYSAATKMWTVIETWWYQIENGWVYVDDKTNLLVEADDAEFEQLRQQREQEQQAALQARMMASVSPNAPRDPMTGQLVTPPIPPAINATQRPIKRIYQAFVCGGVVLARNPSPLKRLKRFIYVPARGYRDDSKDGAVDWFGLVRVAIDMQKQHNVEQTIIVQLMQLMPKGSWYGPKGSFSNKEEWKGRLGQTGQLLEYNQARGKPEPIPVPPIPRHLIDMAFQRPQMMREVTGVNVELTGQRQGNDAGVVMDRRYRAAKTTLSPLFDNYRHSKIEIGKVLLAYIQTYVSVGRRICVIGEKKVKLAIMTEDMSLGQYHVTVDETDSETNDRIATLNILQTTLPQLLKAGVPIAPEFIDLLPMPTEMRDNWKTMLAWQLAKSGALPPPGWKQGDPVPTMTPPMPPQAQPSIPSQP